MLLRHHHQKSVHRRPNRSPRYLQNHLPAQCPPEVQMLPKVSLQRKQLAWHVSDVFVKSNHQVVERNQPREVSNGWWARGFRLGKGPVKYDQVLPCWLHFSCHSTYPIFSAKYPLLYHTISVDHGGKLQDMFVSRITKTLAKTNKLSRRKKRGWYTKEAMSKELGWSTSLVFK